MGKQHILLIDDDQYIRDAYQEVLTEAGFKVATAVDGEEGVVKIREGGYSLILLDVMMPKMDGLGVLKALKENPHKLANGPIILLTNMAHDQVIKEAIALGAGGYLIKSDLSPDQLVVKIKEFIKEPV